MALMKGRKRGGNNYMERKAVHYQDGSLFTASLKRERIKATMERLREKEQKIMRERTILT
eukprot:CAMPEP_0185599780 /NCGR_PEP_ID=MMETSP0434-20130131/82936_1 /TAXON_ID=626734 ORGANISM="Favella taraikaensis, Strain Fe Narragansett Bay" /NCGR_SAMPLE_ID=MMETSP0434 /ASSEMBLY_ACC=CAM_ASM_000379 /LENGTH=59 /DNA_ID=CAMNT_0028229307 /DNA_START=822 /DNA_END=1001 /DNA_ORIENTATION=-